VRQKDVSLFIFRIRTKKAKSSRTHLFHLSFLSVSLLNQTWWVSYFSALSKISHSKYSINVFVCYGLYVIILFFTSHFFISFFLIFHWLFCQVNHKLYYLFNAANDWWLMVRLGANIVKILFVRDDLVWIQKIVKIKGSKLKHFYVKSS